MFLDFILILDGSTKIFSKISLLTFLLPTYLELKFFNLLSGQKPGRTSTFLLSRNLPIFLICYLFLFLKKILLSQ